MGVVDGAVLERLAKIMGYMRTAPGAKPGKRLKKREKRAMLEAQAAAPPPRPGQLPEESSTKCACSVPHQARQAPERVRAAGHAEAQAAVQTLKPAAPFR